MPSNRTAIPGNASAPRTNPVVANPADGDAGAALTFTPSINTVADEVAGLKQRVAYLADGKLMVAGCRLSSMTGAGPYTPTGQFNVASVTRTGSGVSARLMVTFTNAITAASIGFVQEDQGGLWVPDGVSSTTQISFKYFGSLPGGGMTGSVQDFNVITSNISIAVFAFSP
jgi:hypothetical protein